MYHVDGNMIDYMVFFLADNGNPFCFFGSHFPKTPD